MVRNLQRVIDRCSFLEWGLKRLYRRAKVSLSADGGNNYHNDKEIDQMKIQFPAKASMHDSTYRRLYLRIPKAAWIAYQLEKLVGKLIRVTIWGPGEEKPIVQFVSQLRRHRDTGRFVTTMWTDLEPTYYIVTIEEPK